MPAKPLPEDDRWTEPMLPIEVDQSSGMEKATKTKPVKAAAYGSCPSCTAGKVALEPHGDHLFWRFHRLTVWSGAAMPCRTSGARLCDAPDQEQQTKCVCEAPLWQQQR